MSEYEYDAFFSYKRDPLSNEWHEKVMSRLKHWIKLELNKQEIKIFFDTEDIKTGEKWKRKIADSLKKSKCLIAILSPAYFNSQWCLSEWKTFINREKDFSLELIVPARYHDGNHFPQEAKDIQSEDFSEYSSTMAAFWETKDAHEFEKEKLKAFAKDAAKKIDNAPPYDDNFLVITAGPDDIHQLPPITRIADSRI
jgi:hypothetical protein